MPLFLQDKTVNWGSEPRAKKAKEAGPDPKRTEDETRGPWDPETKSVRPGLGLEAKVWGIGPEAEGPSQSKIAKDGRLKPGQRLKA